MEKVGEGYAPPDGPANAKIVLVGEALGQNEAREGKPFVGGSGRILTSMLGKAGIRRDSVRIDNAMRCRPPGNEIPRSFNPSICAKRHLLPDLAVTKPNVIVAFGNHALKVLTGQAGITKRRGSITASPHGKVTATLHPAYIMRQQEMWSVVIADLRRAATESLTPDMPVIPDQNFQLSPTVAELEEFANVAHTGEVAVDIETTIAGYSEESILCVGVSTGQRTMCIPFRKQGGSEYWSDGDLPKAIQALNWILAGPSKKIFQNGFFDVPILEGHGFTVSSWMFDTMLAHHLLYAELPHGLDFIASVHTNVPYYKDDVKGYQGLVNLPDEQLRKYNCKDCLVTWLAAQDLKNDLEERHLVDYFNRMTMRLPRILMGMRRRGMYVDRARIGRLIVDYNLRSKEMRKGLATIGVKDPSSSSSIADLLYETYSLPVAKRTAKGRPSVDEDSLIKARLKASDAAAQIAGPAKILMERACDVVDRLLALRKTEKSLSTYLRGLPIAKDGKIHCSWLQHGTTSERLSSRQPNLQNVPEDMRIIYVPTPGLAFWSFDYSQLELRIMAYEAGEESLIDAFAEGRDIHSEHAAILFHDKDGPLYKQPAWITKPQRDFAKSFAYALNYGGDITSVMRAKPGMLTMGQGKLAQMKYYSRRPKIAQFRAKIEGQVKRTRTLVNSFGRPRIFFGSPSAIMKSAYNYPIQSSAAGLINQATIKLAQLGLDDGLLLQVHDSLMFELPHHYAERAKRIVEIMEAPVKIQGRQVTFPVDVSTGTSWGDMRKCDLAKS